MDVDIQNKKIELIQWLSTMNDISIIDKIMKLREEEKSDWWNEISEAEKKSIEKGIQEANNGKIKPHSEAKKYMKSGYKIFWTDHALAELILLKSCHYSQTGKTLTN